MEAGDVEFGAAVDTKRLVLVDLWAPWCGPCRMMAPAFEEAAQRMEPGARFAKLNTDEAQDIAGKHCYRPRDAKALAKWSKNFPKINLVTIDQEFGGWTKAQKTHFDDGGTFDQVYGNR